MKCTVSMFKNSVKKKSSINLRQAFKIDYLVAENNLRKSQILSALDDDMKRFSILKDSASFFFIIFKIFSLSHTTFRVSFTSC